MSAEMTIWNGARVPRVGLGCWAIGGLKSNEGPSTSYGDVNDAESRAGLRLGYELGARVFDTAPGYGAGHSETLIGEEISHHVDAVIITKFGYDVDYARRLNGPQDVSDTGIRKAIDGSRRRLKRDTLDLVVLHHNWMEIEDARGAFDTMASLRAQGAVAAFGWSTDGPERAAAFAGMEGFVAIEHDLNVFTPAEEMLAVCAEHQLVSINRLPLAMGLLTGKYRPDTQMAANDVRAQGFDWLRFFKDGKPSSDYLDRLAVLQDLLRSGGRTLAQGALGWILARAPFTLPVPGFKTEAQVRDNLGAIEAGALPPEVMERIDEALAAFGPEN